MDPIAQNMENVNMGDEEDEYSALMKKVLAYEMDISHVERIREGDTLKQFKEEYLFKRSEMVFRIGHVVDEIVKNVDMRDLKVFRQLTRSCYDESKGLWRKKAWIRIRNNTVATNVPLQQFTNNFQRFLNSPAEFGTPPENFTLSLTEDDVSTPEWESFKQICGPHIKSLKIEISGEQFNTYEVFERLFPLRFRLPNLERVHMIVNQPFRFNLLLRILKFSKELVVRNSGRDSTSGSFLYIFSYFAMFRQYTRGSTPKYWELRTIDTIVAPVFDSQDIIACNFPLEHLSIRFHEKTTEVELANVLNHHRNKLVTFKLLKCKTRRYTPFVNLSLDGIFVKLTVLEFWGNVVTNLDILRNTPYLKKLKVDYGCFECPHFSGYLGDDMVFQGDMVRNSSRLMESRNFRLEMLQVFVTDCKMSSESWNLLTKWMPNLRVLEAPIPDNTALWTVCDNLRQLEKLRLRFGSEVDDDGVVGHDGDMPGSQGITKLKFLRSFEVEVECGHGRLTDRSAELGFFNLQHLGSLKLGSSGNLLTKEMEGRLRERICHFEMCRSCRNTVAAGEIKRCCEWAEFKRYWRLV